MSMGLKIEALNNTLRGLTKRYTVKVDFNEIVLYDSYLGVVIWSTETIAEMSDYISGFVLGRTTKG